MEQERESVHNEPALNGTLSKEAEADAQAETQKMKLSDSAIPALKIKENLPPQS